MHHDLIGKDDVPAVESKRRFGCLDDDLTFFLEFTDGSGSFCGTNEVKWYCKGGASLEEVERGSGEAGTRRAAWIDDRNSLHLMGKGSVRLCGEWLTATGLLRYLK